MFKRVLNKPFKLALNTVCLEREREREREREGEREY